MADQATIAVTALAKIMDVTPRRVQQYEKEGITVKDGRGRWLFIPSITNYIAYLKRDKGKSVDMNSETARVKKLTADKLQLEIDELKGNLLRRDLIEATWLNMITAFRAKFLSIPVKAAQVALSASTLQEIEDELTTLVHEALKEFSEHGLPNDIARVAADSLGIETPGETDSKPVGRRKKKTVARKRGGARTVANKSG